MLIQYILINSSVLGEFSLGGNFNVLKNGVPQTSSWRPFRPQQVCQNITVSVSRPKMSFSRRGPAPFSPSASTPLLQGFDSAYLEARYEKSGLIERCLLVYIGNLVHRKFGT